MTRTLCALLLFPLVGLLAASCNPLADEGPTDGWLLAIDRETHETRWETRVRSTSPPLPYAVESDRIALLTREFGLVAFGTDTGDREWRYQGSAGAWWSAYLEAADGLIVAPTGYENNLVAIDAYSGEMRWETPFGLMIRGIAHYSDRVFVTASDEHGGSLTALDRATGDIVWGHVGRFSGDVAISDSAVFVSSEGHIDAFDAMTGELRDSSAELESERRLGHPSRLTVSDGYVLATDVGWPNIIIALDAATLTEQWRYEAYPDHGAPFAPELAIGDDMVYLSTLPDSLVALDLGTGEVRWEVTVPPGPVVYDDGAVFVTVRGESDHQLIALDAATGQTRWSRTVPGENGALPVVMGDTIYISSAGKPIPYED